MTTLYIFHHCGKVLLPFWVYDRPLWLRLHAARGSLWDASLHSFVFSAEAAPVWERLITDRPFVEVGISPKTPVSVGNFFKERWNAPPPSDANSCDAKYEYTDFFTAQDDVALCQALHARKYSQKTIKLYRSVLYDFCKFTGKPPQKAESEDVRRFAAYLDSNRNLSASSMNVAISALKFFYTETANLDIINNIARPHGDKKLPAVLSAAEVLRILASPQNIKHRLLLTLTYSAGLRVAEVVKLKHTDIDTDRRTVQVRAGKGRKDRYTLLSAKAAALLNEYYLTYPIDSWLFPGVPSSEHLSVRSAQHIFEAAVRDSGIEKPVTIHSLRHAFATHLLERGTDVRYIQTLLGHTSVRTTERYTHVARRTVLSIASPLDTL